MASRKKKPFARRDVLRSCPRSGDRAAAAGCPRVLKPRALRTEFPQPFCASGPAGRGVDQGTRFYRSRPVRRGNTIFAGTGICSGPGRGNCATPGFIRTDVGMPVADHRIDMCRTGPPCNATAGKAGNDTMDSPALPAVLTGAPSPAFPVRKTAGRFSLRFYARMLRRERQAGRGANGAVGEVRSRTGAADSRSGRLPTPWQYPFPARRPQVRSTQEHSKQEQESGRKLRACTLPQTGSCTRAIFSLFFSLNFRRNPGETG